MRAVVESRHGGPEVLEVTEIPDPACGPQQVLIRVHAAGINRADVLQRQGNYPIPPGATYIYGLEAAGTVLEIGREAETHGRCGRAVLRRHTNDATSGRCACRLVDHVDRDRVVVGIH